MDDATRVSQLREILDIVSRSHAPVIVLELPSQVITAASPGARELLDDIVRPLVGRSLTDYTENRLSDAIRLLADGRITAFESVQVLKPTGQRRRLWIRELPESGPTRAAIAVLLKREPTGRAVVPCTDDAASSAVIGSTDARLMVDRVSSDVQEVLGFRSEEIIGASLLALMVPEDIPEVLSALAESSRRKEVVTARVGVVGADQVALACHLVLLPLTPAPSCAFALLAEEPDGGPADSRVVAELITRLGRGLRGTMAARAVASTPLISDVHLGHLSTRELEIVSLLMAGDRVSSIARVLFLSEGTVRNHLSSAFGKLGVGTQQELIALLRPAATPRS